MKVRVTAILFLVVLLGVSVLADDDNPRLVTVTGDAEIRIEPEEVILTLGVETRHVELDSAKIENDKRVRKVIAFVKSLNIEPKHIKTDFIEIKPIFKFWETESEQLLSGVLKAGVEHVHGIDFRPVELRKYKDQARALAIIAAREKAEALSQELEVKIWRVHDIKEYPSNWWSWYNTGWRGGYSGGMSQNVVQNFGGGGVDEESTIAPGQITIRAKVQVSFELE
jgi:uncharacterized protein YggE